MFKLRSVGQMAFGSPCLWLDALIDYQQVLSGLPEVPAVCRGARMGTGTVEAQRSLGNGQTKIKAFGLDPNEIPLLCHCDGLCIRVCVSACLCLSRPVSFTSASGNRLHLHWLIATLHPASRSLGLYLTLFLNSFMQLQRKLEIKPGGQPWLLRKKHNSMN